MVAELIGLLQMIAVVGDGESLGSVGVVFGEYRTAVGGCDVMFHFCKGEERYDSQITYTQEY